MGPSIRLTRVPIRWRSPASGQSYLHLGMRASLSVSRRTYSHCLGRFKHSLADTGVSPATAEVAAQSFFSLFHRRVGMLFQESRAGHHESRRAKTALLRVVVDEGLHHRSQLLGAPQSFDGGDRMALGFDGQH